MADVLLIEGQQVERAIARVRWAAAALIALLGPFFPNLSVLGIVVLAGYVVAYNLATTAASERATDPAAHRRIAILAFIGDLITFSAAVLLFSSDPFWTTYFAGTLIIIGTAFRFGTRETAIATIVLSAAYLAVSVFRQISFGYELSPPRVAFGVSMYVMTALLVDRVVGDVHAMRVDREGLIRRLERRVSEDSALSQATRIVATVAAPERVVPALLQASRSVLRFDRATVWIADEASGTYRVLHRLGVADPPLRDTLLIGEGLIAAALRGAATVLVPNVLEDPRYGQRASGEIARSIIAIPLRVGGRVVAIFSLSRALPDVFTEDDLRLSDAVAALIAQVLENQRLFAEAGEAEALRALDKLKDEFLAAVSHELRTPLTVISGALEVLGRQPDLGDRSKRLVEQAGRSVERLHHDVQDLLDLAQLQESKIELSREYVTPRQILVEVATAHEVIAARRSQRLIVRAAELPPVLVDRRRMHQILANLVANAIRYSPPDTDIELVAERRGEELHLAVRDRGPGVPEADRERVFDKFYRSPATRDHASGTGLGLAIAKTLAELHGGRVWVKPRADGAGSAFVMALPYESVREPAEVLS
ncbi:MAG: GAF domain-containing protein [Chloroflexi bacterium]|nr:GAF domain-containing protein [Chloroflexota bacterium]